MGWIFLQKLGLCADINEFSVALLLDGRGGWVNLSETAKTNGRAESMPGALRPKASFVEDSPCKSMANPR